MPSLVHPASIICLCNTELSFSTSARSRATSSAISWEGGSALDRPQLGQFPEYSQISAVTDVLTFPDTFIRFPPFYASFARCLTDRRALMVNLKGQVRHRRELTLVLRRLHSVQLRARRVVVAASVADVLRFLFDRSFSFCIDSTRQKVRI